MSRGVGWSLIAAMLVLSVTGFARAGTLHRIAGKVTTSSGAAVSGVVLTCTGAVAMLTTTSQANGGYVLRNLKAGTYVVKASKAGKHYRPSERKITVGPSATGVNFTEIGEQAAYLEHPTCNPNNGNTSTTFTFGITYVDPQDRAPDKAQLYIDGQVKNLSCASHSGNTRRYSLQMSLPAGSHKHRFRFEVNGNVLRYPGPDENDWYNYPTVAGGH
ncbi:MAG: carboxypeptidase-like regulatory domain-containing protein [Armatimonadetes bacterium]|nr:carboxypeptidase-like regulatory domain-containing protein [Armatimonadota bacterium]